MIVFVKSNSKENKNNGRTLVQPGAVQTELENLLVKSTSAIKNVKFPQHNQQINLNQLTEIKC